MTNQKGYIVHKVKGIWVIGPYTTGSAPMGARIISSINIARRLVERWNKLH
jgi:hypothetical protein